MHVPMGGGRRNAASSYCITKGVRTDVLKRALMCDVRLAGSVGAFEGGGVIERAAPRAFSVRGELSGFDVRIRGRS
jgi:hypothetical protein